MRKICLFTFFILTTTLGYSQNNDSLGRDSAGSIQIRNRYQDSLDRANMDRNLSNLISVQKEREKKQKQQAYIRIALGAFFLIVLVVGLTRKRKQKNNTNKEIS